MLEKEEEEIKEINLNVIILGDNDVGKSSLVQILKNEKSKDDNNLVDKNGNFIIKAKYEKENKILLLHLKEPEHQKIYDGNIPKQYILNSHIVLLVFSNIKTLKKLQDKLYKFYKENANIENSRFILIGNKSDTFGNEKDEIMKQGNKFAEEIDAIFLTCSAKSLDNIDNLERFIITEAKRFISEGKKNKNNINENATISISSENYPNRRKKRKCCNK